MFIYSLVYFLVFFTQNIVNKCYGVCPGQTWDKRGTNVRLSESAMLKQNKCTNKKSCTECSFLGQTRLAGFQIDL